MEVLFKKETVYAYPGRLTWLSMEAFGLYVSTAFKKLVQLNRQVRDKKSRLQHILHTVSPIFSNKIASKWYVLFYAAFLDFRHNHESGTLSWLITKTLEQICKCLTNSVEEQTHNQVQEICDHLQCLLRSVPPAVSRELTIRVLRHLENTFMELNEVYSPNDHFEEIAVEILMAILHPSVTKIEFVDYNVHSDELVLFKIKYHQLINKALPKLKPLKALDIQLNLIELMEFNMLQYEILFENLLNVEELTCNKLSWKKLSSLTSHFKNLKVFHLNGAIKSYDFAPILKLSNLEILRFRIKSGERVTDLLNGLARTKRSDGTTISYHLKELGRIDPTVHDIQLLASEFPQLTYISFKSCICDLSPLKALKYLSGLSVQWCSFRRLKHLLTAIGGQIDCLELIDVRDIDLKHIANTCVSLKCLHLESKDPLNLSEETLQDYNKLQIPGFSTVECLKLNFPCDLSFGEYFFTRFPNVRRLHLIEFKIVPILEDLVHMRLMDRLEVVFLRYFKGEVFLLQFFERYVVITRSFVDCRSTNHDISVYSIPI